MNMDFMVLFYATFLLRVLFTLSFSPAEMLKVELQTNLYFYLVVFLNLILSEWKHCYFIP